jgi:acetyltransferase-like isoleucine patch superfamily enzyme
MILRLLGSLFVALDKIKTLCIRRYWISRFAEAGKGISIGRDFEAHAPERIRLRDGVVLANRVTLRAMTTYPWATPPQTFQPEIVLGQNCFLNNGTHLSAVRRISIGQNVMIAENCFLADNNHGYQNPDLPISRQPLDNPGEIHVGDDTWIGSHCVVVGNVRIGRHCVVAAHSVVRSDLPDFSVAAGAPARILKQYDPAQRAWLKSPS